MDNEALKKQRGQFFTANEGVQKALSSLLLNSGTLLEPSAGAGHLVAVAEESGKHVITAFELDENIENISSTPFEYGDFFTLAQGKEGTYDSILGNPPFVAWKDVEADTVLSAYGVKKAYSDKTNLYHLFIDRCIDLLADNGELVFIVPKEWLYTTSANPLRKKIIAQGVVTHFIDCGEEKLFTDADVPALLIFRFVKKSKVEGELTNYAPTLNAALDNQWEERAFIEEEGRLLLVPSNLATVIESWKPLKTQFRVKVGIVSGADPLFRFNSSMDVETESLVPYLTTKGIEMFIDVNDKKTWDEIPQKTQNYLLVHKPALIGRKISKFTENNWWKYGAIRNLDAMLEKDIERFYALVKTRSVTPFFTDVNAVRYSGGVLGVFRNPDADVTVATAVKILNSVKYRAVLDAMFLTTGNKVSLQPSTLEDAPFPNTEEEALAWLAV